MLDQQGITNYISADDETLVKSGKGTLFRIVVGETAAGAITIYDGLTAAGGTVMGVLKASIVEGTYDFGTYFGTGLVIVTAAASKITVVYK